MGGEVVTGLEYDVEMDCDAPVRVQPDGTLTSEPSGSCRLDGQIEQVDPDGMLTLRVGEGLIVAEMDAAQTAPSVGRPVVVLDVPLTVWTQGGGRLDVHDDHVLPIGRRDVRVKLRRRFSPVTDAAYPASIVRVVGLVAAWVVRWIMRTRQWTVAVTIGPDQEHGSERVVHVERAANEAAAVHRAAELKQVLERVADTPQRLSGPLASDEQLANIIRRAVKRQGGDWTNPTVPV